MTYDQQKANQETRKMLMTKLLQALKTPSAFDLEKLKTDLRLEGMEYHARLLEK